MRINWNFSLDFLDYLFFTITALILIVVVSATILDSKMNNENSLNYYKKERTDLPRPTACLLCFSIVRNWYRLTAPPKTEIARDIRFVPAVRYVT